jgi:hypothetical protein
MAEEKRKTLEEMKAELRDKVRHDLVMDHAAHARPHVNTEGLVEVIARMLELCGRQEALLQGLLRKVEGHSACLAGLVEDEEEARCAEDLSLDDLLDEEGDFDH